MTEETAKIFDAPWEAEEYKHGKGAFVVRNNGGYLVAENMSEQNATRLACLPELYDALMWAMVQYCPDAFLFLDECRMCGEKNCKGRKCVELLRKVREREGVSETDKN